MAMTFLVKVSASRTPGVLWFASDSCPKSSSKTNIIPMPSAGHPLAPNMHTAKCLALLSKQVRKATPAFTVHHPLYFMIFSQQSQMASLVYMLTWYSSKHCYMGQICSSYFMWNIAYHFSVLSVCIICVLVAWSWHMGAHEVCVYLHPRVIPLDLLI